MGKLLLGLAALLFTIGSAAIASAQVTGIRHSDGSWTFVDANGRDIHANDAAGQVATHADHHDPKNHRSHGSRPYRMGHHVSGYLPWLSR
jgi:hypothetical protein